MPHDRDGNLLSVGDIVNIPAKVLTINISEEYCNLILETVQPMYPGEYFSGFSLNAKQVVKENI